MLAELGQGDELELGLLEAPSSAGADEERVAVDGRERVDAGGRLRRPERCSGLCVEGVDGAGVGAGALLVLVPIASASAAPAKVAVGNSADGSVLIDGYGKSLYRFGRDTGRKSTCTGECAQNSPPLLTTSTPKAGSGVSARKLGTTRRSDGELQVTYAGRPLYDFIGDAARGDINGEGLNAFGGIWTLVAPSGAKIAPGTSQCSMTPSSTPSPSTIPSASPGFPY